LIIEANEKGQMKYEEAKKLFIEANEKGQKESMNSLGK
jgi:hypothetical protein